MTQVSPQDLISAAQDHSKTLFGRIDPDWVIGTLAKIASGALAAQSAGYIREVPLNSEPKNEKS